ncbi:MAG: NnrS family protein [Candidatus Omnitrophica bacterium]|nr:NnrS family protein [Candidatus Omnitrophota bacterium]
MIRWADCRREPFRLLFPLGAVWGCLGVGHWLGYALHWSEASSAFFHASVQTGLFMSCFVAGFLMTALPRFTEAPPASTMELGGLFAVLAAQAVALSLGWWPAASGCLIGLFALLLVFAGRRLLRRAGRPAPAMELVWVPIGLGLGIAGLGCLAASQAGVAPPWAAAIGRPLAQQGWLLAVIMGVGGFLIPRLLGRGAFVSAGALTDPQRLARRRVQRLAWHGMAGALLGFSFIMEGLGRLGPAYLLRAAVVTAELGMTTQPWRPPAVRDTYAWLVWIALWCLMGGLWGAGIFPRYRVAWLHVTLLGGVSLMTFAVATMVVLSHTGQAQRLRRPLWVVRLVAVGILGAAAMRVGADLDPPRFFGWLAAASISWLAAALGWIGFALPLVLRPADPEAFERHHHAAKQRVMQGQDCG